MTADPPDPRGVTTKAANLAETFADLAAQGILCYPQGNRSRQVYPLDRHASSIDEGIDWLPAGGEARLHSFAVFHQRYAPSVKVPYVVAHIELTEGIRLISTLIDINLSDVTVGMPLKAEFIPDNRLVFRSAGPNTSASRESASKGCSRDTA